MPGFQRLFEPTRDRKGNLIPPDTKEIKKQHPQFRFFVKTEGGVFAFSDGATAKEFAGEVASVVTE